MCLLQVSQPRLLGAPCLGDPHRSPSESGSWAKLLGWGGGQGCGTATGAWAHWVHPSGLGVSSWQSPCTSPESRRGPVTEQVPPTRPHARHVAHFCSLSPAAPYGTFLMTLPLRMRGQGLERITACLPTWLSSLSRLLCSASLPYRVDPSVPRAAEMTCVASWTQDWPCKMHR